MAEDGSGRMLTEAHTTLIVLIVGVFGGLGAVILIIFCCKYCLKKPPQTGLEDIEQDDNVKFEEEKLPVSMFSQLESSFQDHLTNGSSRKTTISSPNKQLQRQPDRVDTVDFRRHSMDSVEGECSLAICQGVVDVYDRYYPEQPIKANSNQWSLERDSISLQNGLRSRPLSRMTLKAGSGSHESRRTLQSSADSSVCTDNRSEITVIDTSVVESRMIMDPNPHSVSQEEQRSQPNQMPFNTNRNYLSAFRPIPKRRQSTQTELSRPSWERCERLIKSEDNPSSNYRLQKQEEVKDEESFIQRNYGSVEAEEKPDALENQPLLRQRQANTPPAQDAQSITSDQSYRQLWQLRSTLEENSTFDDDEVGEGGSIGQTCSSDDTRFQSDGSTRNKNLICNVVYTSFESDNSACFGEDNQENLHLDYSLQSEGPNAAEDNLLHPPDQMYTSRRQNFQRLVNTRGRSHLEFNSSTEKSFDSFDTTTTEGPRSSESSRVEATTTSFESSTTDSDSHVRRQKMISGKDDSGYKSNELQLPNSPTSSKPIAFAFDSSNIDNMSPSSTCSPIIRRSASRKRRDFHGRYAGIPPKNSNIVATSCSSFELDTTDSNHVSGDSFDESAIPGAASSKFNVFYRFFHSNSRYGRRRQVKRDFSVDEKTDALFREFTRYDPSFETSCKRSYSRSNSSPAINHTITRRRATEPPDDLPIPEDWKTSAENMVEVDLAPPCIIFPSPAETVTPVQQITSC